MFGLPMSSKHKTSVINELNELEKVIGSEKFKEVLGRGIIDNGCEFLDFDGLEKSINSTDKKLIERFNIHYADPYTSYQKALVGK